jgi:hypothetical protein
MVTVFMLGMMRRLDVTAVIVMLHTLVVMRSVGGMTLVSMTPACGSLEGEEE